MKVLAADFDGDVLNILYIINDTFRQRCIKILNPRNNFYISRNDGKTNMDLIHNKDTQINVNALIGLSRDNYGEERIAQIKRLQNM